MNEDYIFSESTEGIEGVAVGKYDETVQSSIGIDDLQGDMQSVLDDIQSGEVFPHSEIKSEVSSDGFTTYNIYYYSGGSEVYSSGISSRGSSYDLDYEEAVDEYGNEDFDASQYEDTNFEVLASSIKADFETLETRLHGDFLIVIFLILFFIVHHLVFHSIRSLWR